MTFIGYHDGHLQVEIMVAKDIENKVKAEFIAESEEFDKIYVYKNRILISEDIVIKKDEIEKYKFKVCRTPKIVVSDEDYQEISWDEALNFLTEDNGFELPFSLEAFNYKVCEDDYISA